MFVLCNVYFCYLLCPRYMFVCLTACFFSLFIAAMEVVAGEAEADAVEAVVAETSEIAITGSKKAVVEVGAAVVEVVMAQAGEDTVVDTEVSLTTLSFSNICFLIMK